MSAYFIANYTITNYEEYMKYVQEVIPLLAKIGGKTLVAGEGHTVVEGTPAKATVIIEFADRAALEAWYNSAEYQQIVPLRHANSAGWAIFADEFAMP